VLLLVLDLGTEPLDLELLDGAVVLELGKRGVDGLGQAGVVLGDDDAVLLARRDLVLLLIFSPLLMSWRLLIRAVQSSACSKLELLLCLRCFQRPGSCLLVGLGALFLLGLLWNVNLSAVEIFFS